MKKDLIKKTLSNGIDVYMYADANLKRMIVSYNVKYGTLGYYDEFYYDDKLYKMPPAMAHFIEHTLVETSKGGNMLIKYREKNYEMNALTGPEMTSYYFIGIKDTWKSIEELINMVDDPGFDAENIEKVKNAVVEETNKALDDKYRAGYNANKRNATAAYSAVYENYNVLGTGETTKSITIDDVRVCYDAFYSNENKFLVIGGNFDIDEMVEYLEEIYAKLSVHPNKMRPVDYGDLMPIRKSYEELVKPVANDYVIITYKMPYEPLGDILEADMYLSIFKQMKFDTTSEFVSKLIEDKVIIGGISSSCDFFQGVLAVTFAADVLDVEEFIRRIETQLNTDNLDENLFELIKKSRKVTELSKMDYIYKSLLRFPRSIDFSEKLFVMDRIDKFTLDKMKSLIRKTDWNLKTVTVIKKDKKEKAD